MEISAQKTKLLTNNTGSINAEITENGQRLVTVTSFKYLSSVITDEHFTPEILSQKAETTAALMRLNLVWLDKSISLSSKILLMRSLVMYFFCTLVNHQTTQQNFKKRKEHKTSGKGDIVRSNASHTKTMLATTKSVPRSSGQMDYTKI